MTHLPLKLLTGLARFMWTLHTRKADHWVPIKTVGSFKRMREFSSLGEAWLVEALRASETLEVDEAGENVRRKDEVKEPTGQFERSIYAVCSLSLFKYSILIYSVERVREGRTWHAAEA